MSKSTWDSHPSMVLNKSFLLWFLKQNLPFLEFALRFLQVGFQTPHCDFPLQSCKIALWTLWLNAVIVTRIIVPSWSPAKKTHKPSHNIIPTVLPSQPKEKHPVDWYNIWLLWGSSVSTQVTPSGTSEYLREQLICGYAQNLLFIILAFSATTSNEAFKAKPLSHALTQN